MKKLFIILFLSIAFTAVKSQTYVLTSVQSWKGQTELVSYDTLTKTSKVNLSVFIEVEGTPLGLFQKRCDTIFEVNTTDMEEILRYSPKVADAVLQRKITEWSK